MLQTSSFFAGSTTSTSSILPTSATTATAARRFLKERFQNSPRFGHSSNFAHLFSQDEKVVEDYKRGLIVSAILLFSIFLAWGLVLLVFKCNCGVVQKRRVGFLCGAPFQVPAITRENNNTEGGTPAAIATNTAGNPWISRGRRIFGLCCVCWIVFAITLVAAGIGNLNTTTETIGHGAELGYDYFEGAQRTLWEVRFHIDSVQGIQNTTVEELRNFHSALQAAALRYEGTDNAEQAVETLLEIMEGLNGFIQAHLQDIDTTIEDGRQTSEDVHSVTESIDLRGLQWGLGLVITVIPAGLLGCLWWRIHYESSGNCHSGRVDTCRAWILLPVFVVLVTLANVACCGMIAAGLLNADFCLGGEDQSPDSTIVEIMNQKGKDSDSFEYRAIEYLVRNCDFGPLVRGTPLDEVEDFEDQLNSTIQEVGSVLKEVIAVDAELWSSQVGYNVTVVQDTLEEYREPLGVLLGLFVDFLQGLACQPLYEVYYTVAHQATCTESYTGTFWLFISLLLLSFFGLLALTFRSALYPVMEADSFEWDLALQEKPEADSLDPGGEEPGITAPKQESIEGMFPTDPISGKDHSIEESQQLGVDDGERRLALTKGSADMEDSTNDVFYSTTDPDHAPPRVEGFGIVDSDVFHSTRELGDAGPNMVLDEPSNAE